MQFVYGPVASWRLGRSLGVDILSTDDKTCSFDCVYCQLGDTEQRTVKRQVYVSTEEIEREIEAIADTIDESTDVITFAGMVILTNSALITDATVREELKKLDIVVAKLDALDQDTFEKINRPVNDEIKLDAIIAGLKEFRKGYKGRLCLQMMFVEGNKDYGWELARIAAKIKPDEVQLNTPLRPCVVTPVSSDELERIREYFKVLKATVISVYDVMVPAVRVIDKTDVIRRRGVED
jgi:wyosine [tRNA(Phe)-imidazoG37] synthetase (radical SAM superfamily)